MGKALKKRQKWRNLDISPPPIIRSSSREEKEGEEGGNDTAHPFLKIISKNLDVLITKEVSPNSEVASPPPVSTLPPAAGPAERVKFFYRSDRIPVFDPANCTVVGTARSGLDPVNTAMFVGDPLRYAPYQNSGGMRAPLTAQNSHFFHPPPPTPHVATKVNAEPSLSSSAQTAASEQSCSSMSSSK